MTIFQPPYIMYHILVDEQSLSGVNQNRGIKCLHLYCTFQHQNELQILMPVHNMKSGISGKRIVIDNIEDKVRKIRVNVQIDRVDILFSTQIHICSPLGIL